MHALHALKHLGLMVRPMELLQHPPHTVLQRAVEEVERPSSAVDGLIEVGMALGMSREAAGCVVLQGLVDGGVGRGETYEAHHAAAVVCWYWGPCLGTKYMYNINIPPSLPPMKRHYV